MKNENIPVPVENIILKATAKNPKNRYSSSREMHDDLLTALNEERKDEENYLLHSFDHYVFFHCCM